MSTPSTSTPATSFVPPIGPHGHSETQVTKTNDKTMDIDLSPWVDANGVGASSGGHSVGKEFPGPVVVYVNQRWSPDESCNFADGAYVGEIVSRPDSQTLTAEFETAPVSGDYSVTFLPTQVRTEDSRGHGHISWEDGSVDEIREKLRELASVPSNVY